VCRVVVSEIIIRLREHKKIEMAIYFVQKIIFGRNKKYLLAQKIPDRIKEAG